MLAQSFEPEAHDKVLDNNPDRTGIYKCWILGKGENRSTRIITSRSRVENQQHTQPTYVGFFFQLYRIRARGGGSLTALFNFCEGIKLMKSKYISLPSFAKIVLQTGWHDTSLVKYLDISMATIF